MHSCHGLCDLVTGLWLVKREFNCRPVHVLVIEKWHWDKFFSAYFRSPISIIPPVLNTHSLTCHWSYKRQQLAAFLNNTLKKRHYYALNTKVTYHMQTIKLSWQGPVEKFTAVCSTYFLHTSVASMPTYKISYWIQRIFFLAISTNTWKNFPCKNYRSYVNCVFTQITNKCIQTSVIVLKTVYYKGD